MTDSKKAFAIAAGLAGVAGAATLVAAPNTVSASTGTVTYAEGATTVWQTPAFKTVQRYVVKDQSIAVIGQKTVNGTVWYQIGTNEWIPEIYLQVGGATPAATSTANVKTASTTTATGTFQVEATYTEGAVTVWNNTNYADASGKYLTSGASQTAVATVQANGETWYKLANGGYVPARFAAKAGSAQAAAVAQPATQAATATQASTTTTKAATPATPAADTTNSTTGTTAEDTASTAANTQAAAKTTTAAPAATATTTAKATTPAPAAQTTATPKTAATTATTTQTLKVTYTDSVVTEWKSASYAQAAGKYLASGSTVTAVGTTTANGETWYQLSDGNFVSARFFGAQGTANSSKATTATATPAKTTTTTQTAPKAAAPAATTTTTQAATPAKTTTPAATTTSTQSTSQAQTSTPAATASQTTATSSNSSRSAQIAAVISVAKAQLGKPYVWGGKGPNSFDCSGLTHYAYLNGANKEIGGYTGAQEYAGTVVSISNLQVGDLVFWGSRGATYHVAIYLGGGQYIAAPQPGENVKISSISSYFMPSFGVRVL